MSINPISNLKNPVFIGNTKKKKLNNDPNKIMRSYHKKYKKNGFIQKLPPLSQKINRTKILNRQRNINPIYHSSQNNFQNLYERRMYPQHMINSMNKVRKTYFIRTRNTTNITLTLNIPTYLIDQIDVSVIYREKTL